MASSVPVAGNTVILTCNVTVPERFTHDITSVRWIYTLGANNATDELNSNTSVSSIVRDGDTFYSNLTLHYVMTSDAREYFCVVTFDTLNVVVYTSKNLSVQSKSFL